MDDKLLTLEEVSEYLNTHKMTVYRLAQRKIIPAVKVGRIWRFKRQQIDRWMEEGSNSHSQRELPGNLAKRRRASRMQVETSPKVEISNFSLPASQAKTIDLNEEIKRLKIPLDEGTKLLKRSLAEFESPMSSFIERRTEERILLKDNSVFIKLVFSYPKDHELVKPINDISPSGVSFNINEEEGRLLVGAPLEKITVKNSKYEKVIVNSIVRNCTRIEKDNVIFNRIGIEFILKPFEKSSLRRKLLSAYKLRMPRYSGDLIPLLNWKISFTYKEQHITTNTILNFSKFGIAFFIKQASLILKSSDVLYDFKVQIDGELIYEGECLIVDLQDSTNSLVVRCSLRKGNIDLEKILILSRKAQASGEMRNFLSDFNKFEDVEPEFKADVADLRHFLEKLECRLNIEDNKINRADIKEEHIPYYKEKFLDSILTPISERLDTFFNKLRILVGNFDESKYDLYKYYFQEHAHQFFLKSPFVDRAYHKPLGYAGDYEVMNMIYGNPYAGDSLFAKLINRHAWQQPAADAVRKRPPYVIGQLNRLLALPLKKDKRYFRVMSVGSGSAVEIQEMIRQNKDVGKFIFTLIDADKEALLYAQDKILNLIKENDRKVKVEFVNKAVDQLINDKNLVDKFGGQDLIYSMGLFDYLSKGVIKRLTKHLYELLGSQGKLVIGNFDPSNVTRTYMEYVQDWYLIHRSKEEMLGISEKIDSAKNVLFETENTNITNFLIIEKD